MPREPRYVPPDSLQHITDVLFQNRLLLLPSEELNRRFVGVLARAARKHEMEVVAVAVLATHYHLLLRPRDAEHLAEFMRYLKTNLSKEIGTRLRGWDSYLFDGRFHNVTVSDEEEAQVRALLYVLAQGTKEFLVDRVLDWPGVHCARSLMEGTPLEGEWFDRTAERKARARKGGESVSEEDFASTESLLFAKLPCWEHRSDEAYRAAVAELVAEVDRRAAAERAATGRRSMGVEAILALDPEKRLRNAKRSPKRRFHTASREMLEKLTEAWSAVLAAYREASARLREGVRDVEFPEGTFPPSLPFVPFSRTTSRQMPGTELARGQPA